jgi:hypothetical protein
MTDFAPSRAPGMRSIPPSLTGHCGSPVTKPDFRHNCAALRRAGHGRAPTRGRPERFANPASAGRFPRRRHEQKNRDRDGRKTKNVRRARRNDAKKIERARGGANACRRPMEAAAARWLAPLRPFLSDVLRRFPRQRRGRVRHGFSGARAPLGCGCTATATPKRQAAFSRPHLLALFTPVAVKSRVRGWLHAGSWAHTALHQIGAGVDCLPTVPAVGQAKTQPPAGR